MISFAKRGGRGSEATAGGAPSFRRKPESTTPMPRATIETLTKSITHIELETNPNFFDHFVEGCQFKK